MRVLPSVQGACKPVPAAEGHQDRGGPLAVGHRAHPAHHSLLRLPHHL